MCIRDRGNTTQISYKLASPNSGACRTHQLITHHQSIYFNITCTLFFVKGVLLDFCKDPQISRSKPGQNSNFFETKGTFIKVYPNWLPMYQAHCLEDVI